MAQRASLLAFMLARFHDAETRGHRRGGHVEGGTTEAWQRLPGGAPEIAQPDRPSNPKSSRTRPLQEIAHRGWQFMLRLDRTGEKPRATAAVMSRTKPSFVSKAT